MAVLFLFLSMFPAVPILAFCCKSDQKVRRVAKSPYVPSKSPDLKVSTERVEAEKKPEKVVMDPLKVDKLPESSEPSDTNEPNAVPLAPQPPPESQPQSQPPPPAASNRRVAKKEKDQSKKAPKAKKWPVTVRRKSDRRKKRTLELDETQTQHTLHTTQTYQTVSSEPADKAHRRTEEFFDDQNDDDTLDCVKSIT